MADELRATLLENILPYWLEKMPDERGGYFGRRTGDDSLDAEAPKGAIMHGRILWTMSSAYLFTGDKKILEAARRAFDYIREHFIDREFGGVYQSVDSEGHPLDTRKQFYAIAFVIYGLSAYYRASGNETALEEAQHLFRTIEIHSRDREKGGYIEALARDWNEADDMRLSDKDANSCKTMNTHLHILEAYSALYNVWKDKEVAEALRSLLTLFLEKIVDGKSHHLGLFFDRDWVREDREISYGHDIEASWLLLEAAETLGDEELFDRVKDATKLIAEAALEGRCVDGSMVYERHGNGSFDNEKHWWVQAETLVGELYLWKRHGVGKEDDFAAKTWDYIKDNLVDSEHGEWYWSRLPNGNVNLREDKAGYWKCPYHNGRMAMEAVKLLEDEKKDNDMVNSQIRPEIVM